MSQPIMHLGASYDRSDRTLRLYVNGTEVCTRETAGGDGFLTVNRKAVDLGRWTPNGSSFDGSLDEVRLYGRPLSHRQVFRQVYED